MEYYISRDNEIYIIDSGVGDVNGDRVPDRVYLVGSRPFGPSSPFYDNITIIIQDGRMGYFTRIPLESNAGYNPKLFLGDFTGEQVLDIHVGIASGGSGGYGFYYVYSFRNNIIRKLFDYENFNNLYKYKVLYKDNYKVDVINQTLNKKYTLDISYKGSDYLDEIYDEDGKLKFPVEGQVLGVADVYPVDIDRNGTYDLLAIQRIIGRYNADTLGYVQTALKWDETKFKTMYQLVAIMG